MKLVVDASVALKWFLADRADEPGAGAAAAILRDFVAGRHELLAPPHFMAEMCAVLSRESPATMGTDLRDLAELAIPTRTDLVLYAYGMQLSSELGHHLFDTLYHAVALLEGPEVTLVTAVAVFGRKARHLGQIVPLAAWQGCPPG